MKRILWPGIVAGIVMLASGMLISELFNLIAPSLQSEYTSGGIFRPWSDPLMLLYFVHPFVQGIVIAWIWSVTRSLFRGSRFSNGFFFGLANALTTLPGMLITYGTFTVTGAMILSWTMSGIISSVCGGLVLAYLVPAAGSSHRTEVKTA